MWPRFGVKIGNSTLCVASAKKDGKIEVVANKHGDRVSQAVLFYDGDEIEVGLTAKQKMISKPLSTVCNSFQMFPKDITDNDMVNCLKYIPCEFDKKSKDFILQSQENEIVKKISPFNVCVELFKTCFELARQCHIFEEHPSIVLSVPHYYPHSCWEDLSDAAESAGFHVAQIITETIAGLMAYETDYINTENSKYILCIKSGGLLTSFALFNVCDGIYTEIGSSQPFYLGGNQFTDVLIDFICNEFQKKYYLDPKESKRSMAKIRTAADNCKHSLTTLPSTQIYIDSLMDGVDFNVQMSRARFESLIQPVINKFMSILNNSLDEINKENYKIDEIILAGGSLKIPKIQSAITSKFPTATLKLNFSPDEIVAIGCAQQAMYINSKMKELNSTLSCSKIKSDAYIWYDNNHEGKKLLIKSGTLLPNKTIIELKNSNDNNDNDNDNKNVIFNIQTEENTTYKIHLNNAKSLNGIFRLESKLGANDNNELKIELKCIS